MIVIILFRYKGIRYENFKYLLMIWNCCGLDIGLYFLLVICIDDVDIISNLIDI